MLRSNCRRVLPERKLVQQKDSSSAKKGKMDKKGVKIFDDRLVPYVPAEFAKETIEFFRKPTTAQSLMKLLYSPGKPTESTDDRTELVRKLLEFEKKRDEYLSAYKAHEEKCEDRVFEALSQLPREYYDEASKAEQKFLPYELHFHQMYRKQIMDELSERNQTLLQVYHNLNHIRFPYHEMRRKNPKLFWAGERRIMQKMRKESVNLYKSLKK